MNKYLFKLLSAVCLFISVDTYSQRYLPLLEGNKEWSILSCPTICRMDYYWSFQDTVLGNRKYKILDGFHFDGTVFVKEDTATQQVFLRQVGHSPLTPDYLTYDFSLEVGDSIDVLNVQAPISFNSGFFTVDSVKRIAYLGIKRKTLYLSGNQPNKGSSNHAVWVEGIGSLSIINTPGLAPDVPLIGAINCVFQDGKLIYRNNYQKEDSCISFYVPTPKDTTKLVDTNTTGFLNANPSTYSPFIYPNPASHFVEITTNPGSELNLIDNMGRIVLIEKITTTKQFISIDHIPSGLYHYFISQNNIQEQKSSGKLIISH